MILLVEDDPDHELLTIRALNKSNVGNTVRVARDGAEAIDLLFGAEAIRPQVILLDLKLPKVDGLEVLRRIREQLVAGGGGLLEVMLSFVGDLLIGCRPIGEYVHSVCELTPE